MTKKKQNKEIVRTEEQQKTIQQILKNTANEELMENGRTEEFKEKKRKISVSYTLKAFQQNIIKCKEAKMITELEFQQLMELHSTIVQRWISIEMAI